MRGLWVFFFVIGGVIDLAFILRFYASDMARGLPEIAALTSLVTIAGYQIWRADHPGTSVRRTILQRLRRAGVALVGVLATVLVANVIGGDLTVSIYIGGLLAIVVAALVILVVIEARFEALP